MVSTVEEVAAFVHDSFPVLSFASCSAAPDRVGGVPGGLKSSLCLSAAASRRVECPASFSRNGLAATPDDGEGAGVKKPFISSYAFFAR
jgi:hypothetical protein